MRQLLKAKNFNGRTRNKFFQEVNLKLRKCQEHKKICDKS